MARDGRPLRMLDPVPGTDPPYGAPAALLDLVGWEIAVRALALPRSGPQGLKVTAETVRARFLAKIVTGDSCPLVWTGAGTGPDADHGRVRVGRREVGAHVLAYIVTRQAPIPDGLLVCHTCDNPPCVWPDHLWLGTSGDNLADMARKGRSTHGMRHPQAKLTDTDVHDIRRLLDTGTRGSDVAERYNVSPATISRIQHRTAWTRI